MVQGPSVSPRLARSIYCLHKTRPGINAAQRYQSYSFVKWKVRCVVYAVYCSENSGVCARGRARQVTLGPRERGVLSTCLTYVCARFKFQPNHPFFSTFLSFTAYFSRRSARPFSLSSRRLACRACRKQCGGPIAKDWVDVSMTSFLSEWTRARPV